MKGETQRLCSLGDVPDGGALVADLAGQAVIVVRRGDNVWAM
jgi:nitrite reductase/ring-hydroxylating ferredoxin subunit